MFFFQGEFEDTKEVIGISILKKNRQHNGQKKDKQRSTKHTHKIEDRPTRTPLRTGLKSSAPERKSVPTPLVVNNPKC